MDNDIDVTMNPPIDPAIALASQNAAKNDPATLAREFDAEIERAKAAQVTSPTFEANASTPSMSGGKPDYEWFNEGVNDPYFVLTGEAAPQLRSAQSAPTQNALPSTPAPSTPSTNPPPAAANDNTQRPYSQPSREPTAKPQGEANTVKIPAWIRGANVGSLAIQAMQESRNEDATARYNSTFEKFGLERNSQDANAARVYNESSWVLPFAYSGVDQEGSWGNNDDVAQATMWNEMANPGMWNAAAKWGHKAATDHLDRVVNGAIEDRQHKNDPNYKPQHSSQPTTDAYGSVLYHVRSKEEARLVAGMRKEHKSPSEIQRALEEIRNPKRDGAADNGTTERNPKVAEVPGTEIPQIQPQVQPKPSSDVPLIEPQTPPETPKEVQAPQPLTVAPQPDGSEVIAPGANESAPKVDHGSEVTAPSGPQHDTATPSQFQQSPPEVVAPDRADATLPTVENKPEAAPESAGNAPVASGENEEHPATAPEENNVEQPPADAPVESPPQPDESADSSMPEWLRELFAAGQQFDREQRPNYPYNEVEVKDASGNKYKVDSYDPNKREIVSRKFTQFADIETETGIGYLRELNKKYPSGSTITDSQFNSEILHGQRLKGDLILEVPKQDKPIPNEVLDYAKKHGITIRDVDGKVY